MNIKKFKTIKAMNIIYQFGSIQKNSNVIGKRVAIRIGNGHTEIRAIEGDGRTPKFKEHKAVMIQMELSQEEANKKAVEMFNEVFGE